MNIASITWWDGLTGWRTNKIIMRIFKENNLQQIQNHVDSDRMKHEDWAWYQMFDCSWQDRIYHWYSLKNKMNSIEKWRECSSPTFLNRYPRSHWQSFESAVDFRLTHELSAFFSEIFTCGHVSYDQLQRLSSAIQLLQRKIYHSIFLDSSFTHSLFW